VAAAAADDSGFLWRMFDPHIFSERSAFGSQLSAQDWLLLLPGKFSTKCEVETYRLQVIGIGASYFVLFPSRFCCRRVKRGKRISTQE
jgi:hypothetical protein